VQTYKEKLAHAPGALELLEKLLCMDPKRRISASDALQVSIECTDKYIRYPAGDSLRLL